MKIENLFCTTGFTQYTISSDRRQKEKMKRITIKDKETVYMRAGRYDTNITIFQDISYTISMMIYRLPV